MAATLFHSNDNNSSSSPSRHGTKRTIESFHLFPQSKSSPLTYIADTGCRPGEAMESAKSVKKWVLTKVRRRNNTKALYAPATVTGATRNKPYAPLQIDFNAIKQGNYKPRPPNEPPSPVSPLSMISGSNSTKIKRKQQLETIRISPPQTANDQLPPETNWNQPYPGQSRSGSTSMVPQAQPMQSYEAEYASINYGRRNFTDNVGKSSRRPVTHRASAEPLNMVQQQQSRELNDWLIQKSKDAPLPAPPRSSSPQVINRKPSPTPIGPPRTQQPLPQLQLRKSTFVPLRNSLQEHPELPPLPPMPPQKNDVSEKETEEKEQAPRKKYVVKPQKTSVEPPKLPKPSLPITPIESTIPVEAPPALPPKDNPPATLGADKLYEELFRTLGKSTTAPIARPTRASEAPKDHLTILEETRDDLEARRTDLRSRIWRVEQAMPAYSTTFNAGQRKLMGERLDELKSELATVERDLYELGIKIHRALRRRNKDGRSEGPTHLWVARVCD